MTPTPANDFGGAPRNETRTPEPSGAATGDGAVNSKERAPTKGSRWKLVSDELPPEGEVVLTWVVNQDGQEWYARFLKHFGGRWLTTHDEPPIHTPTHWARD